MLVQWVTSQRAIGCMSVYKACAFAGPKCLGKPSLTRCLILVCKPEYELCSIVYSAQAFENDQGRQDQRRLGTNSSGNLGRMHIIQPRHQAYLRG